MSDSVRPESLVSVLVLCFFKCLENFFLPSLPPLWADKCLLRFDSNTNFLWQCWQSKVAWFPLRWTIFKAFEGKLSTQNLHLNNVSFVGREMFDSKDGDADTSILCAKVRWADLETACINCLLQISHSNPWVSFSSFNDSLLSVTLQISCLASLKKNSETVQVNFSLQLTLKILSNFLT